MLYLSEGRDTSIVETLQNANSGEEHTISLGQWKMKRTVDVLYVVQPDKAKRVHIYEHQLGDRYDAYVKKQIKEYPDYAEFSGLYFAYLNRKFKSDDRGFAYQITAGYSNMCYEAVEDESKTESYGIIYPSVTQMEFFNVALKKEAEQRGLIYLSGVFRLKFRVKKDKPRLYEDLEMLDIKMSSEIDNDGNIFWN